MPVCLCMCLPTCFVCSLRPTCMYTRQQCCPMYGSDFAMLCVASNMLPQLDYCYIPGNSCKQQCCLVYVGLYNPHLVLKCVHDSCSWFTLNLFYNITPGPPIPPSGLNCFTVNTCTSSALSPLLSWNTSHGENITYQLKVLQAAGNVSGGVVVFNVSTTLHLYRVPQAEQCTEHWFMVRAVNPAGVSNYSDPITSFI